MSFDFNDAEQRKSPDLLIPHGTIVPVHLTLRPGGSGPGDWLKRSNDGTGLMLDCEFTVIAGEWERRKFWTYFTVDGEKDGQKEAAAISRSNLRAILESARGILPTDDSPAALAARKVSGYGDLDGLRFVCGVKLEKGTNGYKDKNQFSYAVTPDRKEWAKLDQVGGGAARPAASAGGAPVAKAAARPSWAGTPKTTTPAGKTAYDHKLDDEIPF